MTGGTLALCESRAMGWMPADPSLNRLTNINAAQQLL